MRRRLEAARAELLERPWHVLTAALAVGLAAGPRAPLMLAGAALVLPLLASSPAWLLTGLAALGGGAVVADARLAALDRTTVSSRIGHAVSGAATLQETPQIGRAHV